tara:strand:- start:3675 stop:4268 length:594 start_codon:yes stop_codon:yes gene_type:complete
MNCQTKHFLKHLQKLDATELNAFEERLADKQKLQELLKHIIEPITKPQRRSVKAVKAITQQTLSLYKAGILTTLSAKGLRACVQIHELFSVAQPSSWIPLMKYLLTQHDFRVTMRFIGLVYGSRHAFECLCKNNFWGLHNARPLMVLLLCATLVKTLLYQEVNFTETVLPYFLEVIPTFSSDEQRACVSDACRQLRY